MTEMLVTCGLSEAQTQARQPGLEGSMGSLHCQVLEWLFGNPQLLNLTRQYDRTTGSTQGSVQATVFRCTRNWAVAGDPRASDSLGKSRPYRSTCQANIEDSDQMSGGEDR